MHGSFDLKTKTEEMNAEMLLERSFGFALRNWKIILSATIFTAAFAFIFLLTAVPIYVATTQLLLDTRRERANSIDRSISDFNYDNVGIENMMTILQSSTLINRVIKEQRLYDDPEFNTTIAGPSSSLFENLIKMVGINDNSQANKVSVSGSSSNGVDDAILNIVSENFKGAISIERAPRSFVIAINIRSADPDKAARLANALADAFAVDALDARLESARRASSWLNERLSQLKVQLRDSEEAVAKFRADNNLVKTANMTLNEQQLSEMNAKIVAARTETAEARVKYEQLQQVLESGGYEKAQALPDVLKSTVITSLRTQEADVSRREADLVARYGERHPLVVNVRAEKADIQRAIIAETTRLATNLKNEYEVTKARQQALESNLKEITGLTGSDDKIAIRLRELERNASVNKMLFEDFLSRAKLTQEQSTFEARDSRVISTASPPIYPSYPKKITTLALSIVFGLVLGLAISLLSELLNAGFTTNEQVENLLNLPVLSSINSWSPEQLAVNGKPLSLNKYLIEKPLSRLSESIRSLKTGVRMSDVDNPPQVIQFVSSIPNEGKTTLATCFAYSISSGGGNVLLIDGDLRNPTLSRNLSAPKSAGLVDYLVEAVRLEDIIQRGEPGSPDFISAGSKTNNPPDLMGSERMRQLIQLLRQHYDYIVIDSPPVGPVIDSVIISTIVDKVVVVIRWSSTARQMVMQCVNKLKASKKIAGVVFNLVDEIQAEKYGRYAYSYYYRNRYYKNYYVE